MSGSAERMRRLRDRKQREETEQATLEERVRWARQSALPPPEMITDAKGVYRETTEAEKVTLYAANQDRAEAYARWRDEAFRAGEVASPW